MKEDGIILKHWHEVLLVIPGLVRGVQGCSKVAARVCPKLDSRPYEVHKFDDAVLIQPCLKAN